MHGARTADDKVAPALLGTHSNWHGLESLHAQGERDNDLHGCDGLLSDDYPSDGITRDAEHCQEHRLWPRAWRRACRVPKAPRSAPTMPSSCIPDELSRPKTPCSLVARSDGVLCCSASH